MATKVWRHQVELFLKTTDDPEMKGERLKLLTLLKTRRKTEMQPYRVRSKFIVIPPKVVEGKAMSHYLVYFIVNEKWKSNGKYRL
jgi:hypothetical protein